MPPKNKSWARRIGRRIKSLQRFVPQQYDALNLSSALHNIAVSTLGNLVGGSLMVGAVYWFVHLRNRPPPPA